MATTLERRIRALEGTRLPQEDHQPKQEDPRPNEEFARLQNAGIDAPAPIRGESLKAWLRRFSDAQLAEFQALLES